MPKLQVHFNVHEKDSKRACDATTVLRKGQDYEIKVHVNHVRYRHLHQKANDATPQAYLPRFPKSQTEGWFLVMGDKGNGKVLALKRFGAKIVDYEAQTLRKYNRKADDRQAELTTRPIQFKSTMTVEVADLEDDLPASQLIAFVLSDCYVGLDQRIELFPEP
jgi:hypothetical protein